MRDAKAGKTASAAGRATLENAASPGRWLWRVVAADGLTLRTLPQWGDQEGTLLCVYSSLYTLCVLSLTW